MITFRCQSNVYGKSIGIHNRSNTSILQEDWFLASKSYSPLGNLFLTFKWDPRYRSFLVNYSIQDMSIASQNFWVLKIQDDNPNLLFFFLAWINSSLSMAIILGLADVQRRVWRQLSGSRIDSISIIPLNFISKVSKSDILLLKTFIGKKFDYNLINELHRAILDMNSNTYKNNIRIRIDLIYLKLLTSLIGDKATEFLKEFYEEFIKELQKIFAL